MEKKYNVVELFSGIGSQAKALKNIGMEISESYTCEWDIHAFVAYDAIHHSPKVPRKVLKMNKEQLLDSMKQLSLSNNGKESMDFRTLRTYTEDSLRKIYTAIKRSNNYVDISTLKGDRIPSNIDILTYSFPCQDLSNVGAFHGYKKGIDRDSGSRSSLLWQVGRILKEMKEQNKSLPRYLLMENVPTLLSARHKENFQIWIDELTELGYFSKYFQLNARFFGLPQNRPRLLMISVYVGDDEKLKDIVQEYFKEKTAEDVVKDYRKSCYYKSISVSDLLRVDYSDSQLLNEALECTPNNTVSRREIWKDNPQIVLPNGLLNPAVDVVRTITTKQDRNPNSGNLYFDCGIEGRAKFRYLTPRECFLFMGFTDEDYDNVIKNNPETRKNSKLFPRDKLIRMAGNSIPVKLLEGVFYQVKCLEKLIE